MGHDNGHGVEEDEWERDTIVAEKRRERIKMR
jgi:hypothetical protein